MTLRATQPQVIIIKSRANTLILYMYNSCQNDINNFLYWTGQLHDDIILLQLPESLSLLFSCGN